MKNLGHNRAGKPYHGSVAPFHTPDFVMLYNSLRNGNRSFTDAYELRTLFKKLSADRIRISLPKSGALAYRNLDFGNIFQNLLGDTSSNEYLLSYLEFFFSCYNNPDLYRERVIKSKCLISNKKNRNNLQMALKDTDTVCKRDMMRVMETLQNTPAVLTSEEEEVLGKYKDISRSVQVLSRLFTGMYISPLPKELSTITFNEAQNADPRIGNYYQQNSHTQTYNLSLPENSRNRKRPALYFVNERAIAVIVLRGWIQ